MTLLARERRGTIRAHRPTCMHRPVVTVCGMGRSGGLDGGTQCLASRRVGWHTGRPAGFGFK